MFEKFSDYMYSLLFGPLKKVRQVVSQSGILFKVLGKLYDDNKQDFFQVREESLIISCSELVLNEVGKERDMPRLDGESIDNYRDRLMQKNIIAERAGTNLGIMQALKDAGYAEVYLEPFYIYDTERWAEFIVYLGENTAGVTTNVTKIDEYVNKLKPASARANYITESTAKVNITSEYGAVGLCYPMCGLQRCGAPVNLY